MNGKNTAAIDKIISKEALKDFERVNRLPNGKIRKKHIPYSLSQETEEAREIKLNYVADIITEEEYKAYCLKYNLR